MCKRFVLIPALLGAAASTARAEIPDQLEPAYLEAVISFNAKDYRRTLQQLNELIKTDPKVDEFLELKALTLKSAQNDPEAIKTYAQLIKNKKAEKRAPAELAPYHFELGMILTRQKKPELARQYFEYSARNGFNVAPARLYMGMSDFNAAKWADAEENFTKVMGTGAVELEPVAYF
jgi:tetratricopeptide (TPR) repeat protein